MRLGRSSEVGAFWRVDASNADSYLRDSGQLCFFLEGQERSQGDSDGVLHTVFPFKATFFVGTLRNQPQPAKRPPGV